MLLSSLVAGFVLAQADVPRDVRLPVMPMWQFGEWVEGVTGREVEVQAEARDRLVYVNVKQRRVHEVLGFVKEAVGVVTIDDGRKLTLKAVGETAVTVDFSGLWKNLRSAPVSESELRKVINELYELMPTEGAVPAKSSQSVEFFKKLEESQSLDALSQMGFRLLQTLGNRGISELPDGQMVVFSSRPTRLQRGWGGFSEKAIDDLAKQMELQESISREMRSSTPKQMYYEHPFLGAFENGPNRKITRVKVEMTRTGSSLNWTISGYDYQGHLVQTARPQGRFISVGGSREDAVKRESRWKAIGQSLRKQEFSQDLTQPYWRRLQLLGFLKASVEPPSNEDLDWLSQVDKIEPLGQDMSQVFDDFCQEQGIEVVTSPSPLTRVDARTGLDPLVVARILLANVPIDAIENRVPGQVLIEKWESFPFASIMSRRAMAFLARSALSDDIITLQELVDGMSELPDSLDLLSYVMYGSALRHQFAQFGYPQGMSRAALQILKGLPRDDQIAILAGGSREWRLDSSPDFVKKIVYSAFQEQGGRGLYKVEPNGMGFQLEKPDGWPDSIPYSFWTNDISYLFDQPEFAVVKVRIEGFSGSGIQALRQVQPGNHHGSTITPENLGFALASLERPETARGNPLVGFGYGKTDGVRLVVIAGPVTAPSAGVTLYEKPINFSMDLAQLPEAERKVALKSLEDARRRNVAGNQRGQVPPP